MQFISERAETHNEGKKPIFLQLENFGEKSVSLVFKPRNAKIDQSVIEVFKKINQGAKDGISLPKYEIFNVGDSEFSVWEKVEGHTLKELGCEDMREFFHKHKGNKNLPKNIENRFNKMRCILSRLDISDLHSENIILRGVELSNGDIKIDPEKFDIVPIDLEVRHKGYVTLLQLRTAKEDEKTCYTLTKNEEDIIDKANKELDGCIFRVLPMRTSRLRGEGALYGDMEEFAKAIFDVFEKERKYEMTITPDKLRKMLIKGFLNTDVPCFTENSGTLYYQGKEIGTKKG